MRIDDVIKIFAENKDNIINLNLLPSATPKVILLGGQGAVGKSNLTKIVLNEYNHLGRFLSINGDDYRIYHPSFHDLVRDNINFPKETQVFSNVFTENLIKIAAEKSLCMVIEGTMRNPSVPIGTARFLKEKGYSVEIYAIAAPGELSSINGYYRYANDKVSQGYGRLVDMKSHDQAVDGLPKSLDELQASGLVDRIKIYSMFAKNLCADIIKMGDNEWNTPTKPSDLVFQIRAKQLCDIDGITHIIEGGKLAINAISPAQRIELTKRIGRIENLLNNLKFISDKQISDIKFFNVNNKWFMKAIMDKIALPMIETKGQYVTAYKNGLIGKDFLICQSYSNYLRKFSQSNHRSFKL